MYVGIVDLMHHSIGFFNTAHSSSNVHGSILYNIC